jgi:PAS domain-containing protein
LRALFTDRTNEEIKREFLHCFNAGEAFSCLAEKLNGKLNFHQVLLFEIDWLSMTLHPISIFPSISKELAARRDLFIPLINSVSDIFSLKWFTLEPGWGVDQPTAESKSPMCRSLLAFPLKVDQRVSSLIAFSGFQSKEVDELEQVSSFLEEISPLVEKCLLMEKTARRNQRLETILNSGNSNYFIIDRAGDIIEFIPGQDNFLEFNPEEVTGQSFSRLFSRSTHFLEFFRDFIQIESKPLTALLKFPSTAKVLSTLTVEKILLRYNQEREYFLVKVERYHNKEKTPPSSSSGRNDMTSDGDLFMRVHFCPENLHCVKRLGRHARYMGEGIFLTEGTILNEERCKESGNCLTDLISVGNNPDPKFI